MHVTLGDITFQIDRSDWQRLEHLPWRTGYNNHGRPFVARQTGSGRTIKNISIYHDVLGVVPSTAQDVDHINCDPLDNRKANLRLCTRQQNTWNRRPKSGLKGVSKKKNRFIARIMVGGRVLRLGSFLTAHEAAHAYDAAATKHFGEYAWLNRSHFMLPTHSKDKNNV